MSSLIAKKENHYVTPSADQITLARDCVKNSLRIAVNRHHIIARPPGHISDMEAEICVGSILAEKYELLEEVGSGGMSTAFKAVNLSLGNIVCIKVLRAHISESAEAIRRFQLEARALAAIQHPNIIRVFAIDRQGDHFFMVTEFVEGLNLRDVLDRAHLDESRIRNIFSQLLSAVEFAHLQGIIHRDLKPSNIIIADTPADTVKVLDFGIAKLLDGDTFQRLTRTGVLVGTPNYMSPEQCLGERIDPRCDIYSLGCLLYEMLAGKPPFSGDSPLDIMYKHLNETAPFIAETGLGNVAMRAMQKSPADRFQSAAEMLAALEGRVPSRLKRRKRRFRVQPIPVAIAVASATAAGLLISQTVASKSEIQKLEVLSTNKIIQTLHDKELRKEAGDEVFTSYLNELNRRTRSNREEGWALSFTASNKLALGKEAEAEALFKRAIKNAHIICDIHKQSIDRLSWLYQRTNRMDKAAKLLEEECKYALAHRDVSSKVELVAMQFALGQTYFDMGQYDQAINTYRTIIKNSAHENSHNAAAATAGVARCMIEQDRTQAGLDELRSLKSKWSDLVLDETRREIWIAEVRCLLALDRPGEALAPLAEIQDSFEHPRSSPDKESSRYNNQQLQALLLTTTTHSRLGDISKAIDSAKNLQRQAQRCDDQSMFSTATKTLELLKFRKSHKG